MKSSSRQLILNPHPALSAFKVLVTLFQYQNTVMKKSMSYPWKEYFAYENTIYVSITLLIRTNTQVCYSINIPFLTTFLFFTLLSLSVGLSTGFPARPAPLPCTACCAAGRPGAPGAPDMLAAGFGAPSEIAAYPVATNGRNRRLFAALAM